jgi:hypothetical protein
MNDSDYPVSTHPTFSTHGIVHRSARREGAGCAYRPLCDASGYYQNNTEWVWKSKEDRNFYRETNPSIGDLWEILEPGAPRDAPVTCLACLVREAELL